MNRVNRLRDIETEPRHCSDAPPVTSSAKHFARALRTLIASKLAPTALTLSLIVCAPAFAQTPTPSTIDPALEARVKTLSAELRCLVCQNQSVADSDAPVARDMRDQVRAQLAAGKSNDEVKRYMTERFGDFVLYRPPLKATTFALWVGPFIVLAMAAWIAVRRVRARGAATTAPSALSEADRARARAMLE